MKKKVGIIGHFGFDKECLDGQTIKTKIVSDELIRLFGKDQVALYDTHSGIFFLLKLPFVVSQIMIGSRNIIILPGMNGLVSISPLLVILNTLFKRKLHYVVIGGWLPKVVSKNKFIRTILKRFDNIMVETQTMKDRMEAMSFGNVTVMSNFKRLNVAKPSELNKFNPPYPLCTFSRVIKEKGIEDAIKAVKICNDKLGFTGYTLNIFGQIGNDYQQRFNEIIKKQPENIKYCGCIDYSDSTKVLKEYFALLFPTYYKGECFAGTIIDAFSAGLPVIASDWHDNSYIIKDKETGFIFPTHSIKDLADILFNLYNNPSQIDNMRVHCLQMAASYQPEIVISTLATKLI